MRVLKYTGLYIILAFGAVISILPFLTAIFVSLKPAKGLFSTPMWYPPLSPSLENFRSLFAGGSFALYILVTVIVVIIVTAGQVVFSMLSAYAFARLRFRGRDTLFWAFHRRP